jgi:nucleoside 2-deoxyribosyltransferase
MAKVYIAGPMTGLPDDNFPAFLAAAKAWREAGWEVCNPAEAFDGAHGKHYRDYVEADMELLKHCDAIAMLEGWDSINARGSIWERQIAVSLLGIPVYNANNPVVLNG